MSWSKYVHDFVNLFLVLQITQTSVLCYVTEQDLILNAVLVLCDEDINLKSENWIYVIYCYTVYIFGLSAIFLCITLVNITG